MRIISVLVLLLLSLIVQTGAQQGNDSIKNQTEEITITEAVEIALKNNPNLKAFEYELTFLEKQKFKPG
ncbi:MAG: hypothetical protein M5T52_23255 [Ignavibacteriaceae bacterium]|nr:hypothetical protein [Ignavibacteriaceae bacterium]